jgi:LacI family transcriptional regulator
MTTIRDVAAACGVSPMTVSLVLNNRGRVSAETRERVLQVVRELDYRPGVSEPNSRRKPINVLGVMAGAKNA